MDGTAFRGTAPALVTPMTADGEIDFDAFAVQVERCIAAGVDFLVPCGTTGESATLTPDEQRAVVARTVEVAAGRVPVLAGAGSNDTATAVGLARGARAAGADGVLVVTPYYNKPSPDGLALHYARIAEAGLPIVLYNVPGRTGSNVPPEVVLRTRSRVPAIVGVKEAAGRIDQVMTLVAHRPDGFVILSGDDDLAFASACLGIDGLISVVANEAPGETTRLVRAGLDGDLATGRDLQYRLLPLMRANFVESNPGPVKAALELMGVCAGHLRAPLAPPTEDSLATLRAALDHAGLNA